MPEAALVEQKHVNEHFHRTARYWKQIYEENDLFAVIHQQRRAIVLDLVEQLHLPQGARVLEVGCGTGITAVAVAQRGYRVDAMDSVPAMIDLAREQANANGVSSQLTVAVGDCHQLTYRDQSFDLVIAMGVTPFLHSLPTAMREIARVLRPGGHLIINADNRWRLNHVLNPLYSPFFRSIRQVGKRILRRLGLWYEPDFPSVPVHMYSRREFDRTLADAGFQVTWSMMLGFGPFGFLDHRLPDGLGRKLHRLLQWLANRRVPILRATGSQYMVLAARNRTPIPVIVQQ